MKTVLANANVIDAVSPEPRTRTSLIIQDGRITRITRALGRTDRVGAKVIDLTGMWLLPGLWDAHNHMVSPLHFPADETMMDRFLRQGREAMDAFHHGITALRVLGVSNFSDVAWRRAFDGGLFLGPRVVAAGHALTTSAGHGRGMGITLEADGSTAFRRLVREQILNGADLIKIIITGGVMGLKWDSPDHLHYLPDELEAVFQTAKERGYPVAAHAGNAKAVKAAVKAGAHTIEHGYDMDEEAVALLAQHGTYYTPTLCVTFQTKEAIVTKQHKAFMARWPLPSHLHQRANERRARHVESFRMALEAGVKIISGSDAGPLADTALMEIELLVHCGMSPMQAIVAATRRAAEASCMAQDVGTVEPGKLADLIVLAQNPLEEISNIRTLKMVFREGKLGTEQGSQNSAPSARRRR